ncbi:MAG TPA: CBS domain-containing protein [Fimbriimonadaceae bacterium]|nr:CBS domain-containing protein [Fimbriimonadaceae bacterium]
MRVSEIMTGNPAYCMPFTKLEDVARMMVENDCGAIPVVESEETKRPVGVVTDRDIAVRTVAMGLNPLEMMADAVMSAPVQTVEPDTDLHEALRDLEENQLRRLVVVDQDGCLCGMVAQADIARHDEKEVGEMVREVSEPGGGEQAA